MLLVAMAAGGLGCRRGPDPRLATPEATVHTLLSAYGIADTPEREVRRRLATHARFVLRDHETYRACFADFLLPSDAGLGGFVVGALAATKDHLRFERDGAVARVFRAKGRGDAPIAVLHRSGDGWKIVLRRSVPPKLALQLRQVYRRADERVRRHGGA